LSLFVYNFGMAPAAWRKKKKLSLRNVAKLIGVRSAMTVLNYESGAREMPNSVALAYERESDGEVSAEDIAAVRRSYLRLANVA
jgi:transcriptional regulator with XRE-family HTH domain